jgi:peptidoglycan/LPS O-acetylase OafA/YrhL
MPKANSHIAALDGVRAVAILLVMTYHFWLVFQGPQGLVGKLITWGQTGVPLFFVLSGFLITGILLDARSSLHYFKNFFARRTLRIFPLYYATLIVLYVLLPLAGLRAWGPFSQQFWFWIYLQNIPPTFGLPYDGPTHFWSLAVEEHYYLVWPFLVRYLNRHRLLLALAVAIAISLLSRALLFSRYSVFYFTLCRLDGLAIGSALAVFARDPAGLQAKLRPAIFTLLVVAPAIVVSQLIFKGASTVFAQVVQSTLIVLIHGAFLVLVLTNHCGRLITAVLTNPIARSIGKYSYAMYVLHPFIMFAIRGWGLHYSVLSFLINSVAVYACAALSWFLLERHFLALKDRFTTVSPPEPALSRS